jgi:hypothetical protein
MTSAATVINFGRRRRAAPSTIASRKSTKSFARPSRARRSYTSVRFENRTAQSHIVLGLPALLERSTEAGLGARRRIGPGAGRGAFGEKESAHPGHPLLDERLTILFLGTIRHLDGQAGRGCTPK